MSAAHMTEKTIMCGALFFLVYIDLSLRKQLLSLIAQLCTEVYLLQLF